MGIVCARVVIKPQLTAVFRAWYFKFQTNAVLVVSAGKEDAIEDVCERERVCGGRAPGEGVKFQRLLASPIFGPASSAMMT